jgi:hypothetical protein
MTALRREHAFGAAASLLLALAVWPWLVPPIPATRPLVAAQASTPAPALVPLPSLASFAAIVERPLFTPSRRPPAGASVTGASIEGRYRLIGIVATGPKKKAFVADGARRREIAEGEALDGWQVKEIGQDRVLLSSPAGETVLKLKQAAEPAKPQ